jgi:ribosomal protein S18 acetylase RimI-like enzyme
MSEIELNIESAEPQAEAIQFLDDKIYEFNSAAINKNNGHLFAKIVRDENNNIIAGISGWTWAMISEITLLWVAEEYRRMRLGIALLKAAEREIIKRGCTMISLRSYSFQAPLFYEKNGYKTVYILDDFPAGYKYYTLVKKIDSASLL